MAELSPQQRAALTMKMKYGADYFKSMAKARKGGRRGIGMESGMTKEERSELAKKGAKARWKKD